MVVWCCCFKKTFAINFFCNQWFTQGQEGTNGQEGIELRPRELERYPLYFGGRFPPGELCPSSCVLGEARSAPRGVLSRLKFLFYFYFGKLIKIDFLFSYLSISRSNLIISR